MHPDLGPLVELQRLESILSERESRLQDVPRRRSALEAELAAERQKLDQLKEALSTSQKTRKSVEAAVQDLETRRSRYKGQLMEVKTNKEYTAMLHEIETVEKEIRSREDSVLQEMEKAETLQAELKAEEQQFKAVEQRQKAAMQALDTEQRELETAVARLRGEREAEAAKLTEDTRELYDRVAKKRGTAVAEAKDGMCQVCHLKLRLQMYIDVKKRDALHQCPGCNRLLFYEPPAPEVLPPA